MKRELKALKRYFSKKPQVLAAFLFGSQAKKTAGKISDWDIAVYFKPKQYLELEVEREFPDEYKIWSELIDILKTDEVDFVVLNRARPELVFSILNSGIPLKIKNRKFYLELLSKTHYEAVDFREFAFDFWKIAEKSKSLTKEDKFKVLRRLKFLEKEWEEFDKFEKMGWPEYRDEPDKRRNIERWIENLVMASLDIAKIISASKKELIPDSYKSILKNFTSKYLNFNEEIAEKFSEFVEFRNIVVHEYLDIKWKRIKNFIKKAEKLYTLFIKRIKTMVK